MPYVDQQTRLNLEIFGTSTAGELNYEITQEIIAYLLRKGLSYQTCNDIVGALDNAKHEFRRRIQDPYEIRKAKENGDVYQDVMESLV